MGVNSWRRNLDGARVIAAVFALDLIDLVGRLLGSLRALRSIHFGEALRSDWFVPCAASILLPLVAVVSVIYLAVHFAG